MKIKQLFLSLLFIGVFSPIYSQLNTVSSGGNISNSSGSISFTFGQVFINNVEGDNGAINEGIQQPYTSEIITGIELNEIQLQLFPNPTRVHHCHISFNRSRPQCYCAVVYRKEV